MYQDKTLKYDSENEDYSLMQEFPSLFKSESISLNREHNDSETFQSKNKTCTPQLESETKTKENSESIKIIRDYPVKESNRNSYHFANGNFTVKKRINNQMKKKVVNKISKEMGKCSKQYFKRVFAKEKKHVLLAAKQVSY